MTSLSNDKRRRELAKIHLASRDLGLDRETYLDVLRIHCNVGSAADLDDAGRRHLLDYFRSCGWQPKQKRPHPGRPHNLESFERGPQLKKVEALLAEARRPWTYADSIAKRMFHVDRVLFCNPEQLHKLIAALMVDARRHQRYMGGNR